jgi:hypothetical protein
MIQKSPDSSARDGLVAAVRIPIHLDHLILSRAIAASSSPAASGIALLFVASDIFPVTPVSRGATAFSVPGSSSSSAAAATERYRF